jgi:predicted nucleic acid-binding protein
MVWDEATRRETARVLRQIPRLSWDEAADLFREEDRFPGETRPERFACIPDPDDRKFAALAEATGAALITNDRHLLQAGGLAEARIMTPGEFCRLSGPRLRDGATSEP